MNKNKIIGIFSIIIFFILFGCVGNTDQPAESDSIQVSVDSTSDSTTDIIITTDSDPGTADILLKDNIVSGPQYTYTATSKKGWGNIFTIEQYEFDRQYSSFIHIKGYSSTQIKIKGALYHRGIVHFVGSNGNKLVWKYYNKYNIFPVIKTAAMEDWYNANVYSFSKTLRSLDDIIVNPDGGFYLAMNYFYDKSNIYTDSVSDGIVNRTSGIDYSGGNRLVVENGTVDQILMYKDHVVAFGKKNNQLFIRRFYSDSVYNWAISNALFYFYPYNMEIQDVFEYNGFFYILSFNPDRTLNTFKIVNPYIP